MARGNNYLIQAQQARDYFLTYDQEYLIRKFQMERDGEYFYIPFLGRSYRLDRRTGELEYREGDTWHSGNSHGEVMTFLDILCDSRADRCLSGKLKNLQSFGKTFHTKLAEDPKDPLAQAVGEDMEGFRRASLELGGRPVPGGDMSFAYPLMDGLELVLQFWEADEDFPAQISWFLDENALMYLKYETMWFAIGLLKERILEAM